MLLLGVFAAILLLPSCAWFKPAQDDSKDKVYKDDEIGDIEGTKVYDPATGEWRTVREVSGKVDTVKWKDLSEEKYPPITTGNVPSSGQKPGNKEEGNNGNAGNNSKNTYNVSLLLPFLTNTGSTGAVDANQLWAVHFYGGAKLAYDDLEREGVKLNVTVMDSEASSSKVNSLLKGGDLPNSDLIIGPYKRENVEIMAGFAAKNQIPLVVPYTASMGMAENNPNYLQVNPSLKSHCEAITRHARKQYRTDDIVLVALDKPEEKARLEYFQATNALIEGKTQGSRFVQYLIPEGASNFARINVGSYIREGRTTVFIVPSWSNETFIYSLLLKLMAEQSKGEDIVVYGMPMWMDYEQIDFDYYEKLHLHVSTASYLNPQDERVKQFKQQYFSAYGTVPTDEAYLGYDTMLYFGKMLAKHGKKLSTKIDSEPSDVLHGRFEFNRVVLDPGKHKENLDYFDQLENTFVNILKFKDFQLQPAD